MQLTEQVRTAVKYLNYFSETRSRLHYGRTPATLQRFFVIFFSFSKQMTVKDLKTGSDHFLPIHHS